MFENSVNLHGRSQTSILTGAQTPEKLLPGVYDCWGPDDTDVYIKVHPTTASDVTSGTGFRIKAGNSVPLQITTPAFLGVTGGTLKYHQVA